MATQDDDLRGALESAFDSAAEPETATPPAEVKEPPVEDVNATPSETAQQPPASERSRDEQGRFAKKPDEPTEGQPDPQTQPEVQLKKPPSSLKKEVLEEWGKLAPHVQDEFLRREADFHKGLEGYKSKAQFADAMHSVLAPFEQTMQQLGVSPEVAVSTLLNADSRLRNGQPQEKAGMLQQLVADYRIDPGMAIEAIAQLAGLNLQQYSEQQATQQPRFDPNLARLQAENNALKAQQQREAFARQQAQTQELNSSIAAFRDDPAHGHFDAVRGHMASLLESGAAKDLKEAYGMAVWANPTTRQALVEQQRKEAEEQANATALAQRQRRAAVSVTGSPSGSAQAAPQGSLRDQIEDAWSKHA